MGKKQKRIRRKYCRNGHNYKVVGVYIRPDGRKQCRGCQREADMRHARKKKQEGGVNV